MKNESETKPYNIAAGHNQIPPAGILQGSSTCSRPMPPGITGPTGNRPTGSMTDRQTIFLIDDENMIIEVGTRMLEKLGYNVLTAESGKSALKLFSASKQRIDLVILDLIMPDIAGTVVLKRLRDLDPAVKVILSSGYNLDGKAQSLLEKGRCEFIQKPFNLASLKKKIDSLINQP